MVHLFIHAPSNHSFSKHFWAPAGDQLLTGARAGVNQDCILLQVTENNNALTM